MIKRFINLPKSRSFFLFGARSSGKTTLLESYFPRESHTWIDLLDPLTEEKLRHHPSQLKSLIEATSKKGTIVIDEIQKNPTLLDVVHQLIQQKNLKFALTGSSARNLKRGAANLLAGRAFRFECYPLTHAELDDLFQLESVLKFGSLPETIDFSEQEKKLFLRSYVETYFREEVVAEQLVRNLIPFKNFLEIASQANGKILNMNNIAHSVGVEHPTVNNYFSILEDTLLAFFLPPYHASIRERQRGKAKFYYFDLGVQRALSGKLELPMVESSYDFGDAFEHFIVLECFRLSRYLKPDWKLFYLKTSDNAEIDLVIERPGEKLLLVEIKSTLNLRSLNQQKLVGFKKLCADIPRSKAYLVSRDETHLFEDGIYYVHFKQFFAEIFGSLAKNNW